MFSVIKYWASYRRIWHKFNNVSPRKIQVSLLSLMKHFQVSYKSPLCENPIFRIFLFTLIYLKVKFWGYTAYEQHGSLPLDSVPIIQPALFSESSFAELTLESLLRKYCYSFLLVTEWLCKYGFCPLQLATNVKG